MEALVYVAGPLFSEAERRFLERMVDTLAKVSNLDPSIHFFLPHRDGGELGKGPSRRHIFELDMQHIDSSSIVVALLDGQDVDSGTCIELGYAYAKRKKIFGLLTDFRAYETKDEEPHRPNLMVWGVCENGNTLVRDLDTLAKGFKLYIQQQSSERNRIKPQ